MVDWIDTHLSEGPQSWFPLFEWIERPMQLLLDASIDGVFRGVSWIWICLGVGILGWLVRGARVGIMCAGGLITCGLLGSGFWRETAHTLGVMTVVMAICVSVGVPIGIAAGRSDALWRTLRRLLDAMQVVHPFVYLLPFLFFFGLGDVGPAVMIIIYSIGPIIRLTNLGVRELPIDVIDAARSFGATRRQMMRDVYVPMARPAILTGVNQTLILALSMHAIAGLLGGGGLGRLLFRGLTSVGMPQVIGSGVAFVLVALVLDALTRPPAPDDVTLMGQLNGVRQRRRAARLGMTSNARRPGMIEDGSVPTPLSEVEHKLAELTFGAGLLVMASAAFMTWSANAGRISSHARAADTSLPGLNFDGLAASGGTWFGGAVLIAGGFAVFSAITVTARASVRNRWVGPHGVVVAGVVSTMSALTFMLTTPGEGTTGLKLGLGPVVALVASTLLATAGAIWTARAPWAVERPRSTRGRHFRRNVAAIGLALVVIGGFSSWTFDTREEPVITPEVQAELDRLLELARVQETAARAAADFRALMAKIQAVEPIARNGFSERGAGLGTITVALGASSLAITLAATRRRRKDHTDDGMAATIALALALAAAAISVAWIASIARVADPKLVSGVGAPITMAGAIVMAMAHRSTLSNLIRARVDPTPPPPESQYPITA